MRKASRSPKVLKGQEEQIAKKRAEIERVRALVRAGTLSQPVAQAAIEAAQEEIRGIERMQPAKEAGQPRELRAARSLTKR